MVLELAFEILTYVSVCCGVRIFVCLKIPLSYSVFCLRTWCYVQVDLRVVKGVKGINRRCGASAEGKLVCTMPSREEEKTPKGD